MPSLRTTAPGASAPGDLPVRKFALAQMVTPQAWDDISDEVVRRMGESIVLEAFRQGAGLIERPRHEVEGRVWSPAHLDWDRPALPDESPTHYVIRMTAQAVVFDG